MSEPTTKTYRRRRNATYAMVEVRVSVKPTLGGSTPWERVTRGQRRNARGRAGAAVRAMQDGWTAWAPITEEWTDAGLTIWFHAFRHDAHV